MCTLSFIPLFKLDIIAVGEVPYLRKIVMNVRSQDRLYYWIPMFPDRPLADPDVETMPVFGIGNDIAMFIMLDKDTSRNKTTNSHGGMQN